MYLIRGLVLINIPRIYIGTKMTLTVRTVHRIHKLTRSRNKLVELQPSQENSLATLLGPCHSSHRPNQPTRGIVPLGQSKVYQISFRSFFSYNHLINLLARIYLFLGLRLSFQCWNLEETFYDCLLFRR